MSRKGWCILLVVCLSVVTTASTDAAQTRKEFALRQHRMPQPLGPFVWQFFVTTV